MSSTREELFATLRAVARPSARPDGPNPGQPTAPADLEAAFVRQVRALGVHVHHAADEAAAATVVRELAGGGDVAVSDAALVRRVTEGVTAFDGWVERERLVDAVLGVSGVQAAVAETGTLMLDSSVERHRVASLVPPVHVALVRPADLVPDLETAFTRAHEGGLPPAVSFITGPSRTADIELQLVVGVHGPRELHVVLLG